MERNLELLTATVMIPPLMLEDFYEGVSKLGVISPSEYVKKINEFAFAQNRDYAGFGRFLEQNSTAFAGRYAILKDLSQEEIDYIFNRIVHERRKLLFS